MIALLYRDWLCLALAGRVDQMYTIQACISVNNIRVEAANNGRGKIFHLPLPMLKLEWRLRAMLTHAGLQCPTAPYSWKLVFMCDHQLYEMIMTACTPTEEEAWRSRLSHPPVPLDFHTQKQPTLFSSLFLDMRPLGTVFGKPGSSLLATIRTCRHPLTLACRNNCQKNIYSSRHHSWTKISHVPGHIEKHQCREERSKLDT